MPCETSETPKCIEKWSKVLAVEILVILGSKANVITDRILDLCILIAK